MKVRVVARMVTTFPSYRRQTKQFLRPVIEDRLAKMEEFGDTWKEAPVRSSWSSFDFAFVIHAKGV